MGGQAAGEEGGGVRGDGEGGGRRFLHARRGGQVGVGGDDSRVRGCVRGGRGTGRDGHGVVGGVGFIGGLHDAVHDGVGVHGVGGYLGTVLCGIFAAPYWGGLRESSYSIGSAVWTQFLAATITAIYSVVATIIILLVMRAVMSLRVDGDSEHRGLDLSEHEERGYIL